jgi:hypothetical protein
MATEQPFRVGGKIGNESKNPAHVRLRDHESG